MSITLRSSSGPLRVTVAPPRAMYFPPNFGITDGVASK
jgi:hypothetical protein